MQPPDKLYVYEIVGRVYPPAELTGPEFLGCWREGDYSYLFFSQPRAEAVRGWLAANGEEARYSSENIMDYADWEAGQALKATSVAGFHLCPLWESPRPAPGETLLRLEPGLAFGSGYHPTTRRCLELLRQVYDLAGAPPQRVLDLGTGTGVLALAAVALGARQVVAVEYNELAVRTAAKNIRQNQLSRRIHLIQGDARDFAYVPADLALANIHLDVLLDLLQIPEFLNKQWYIFSGILGAQMAVFADRLKATPLKVLAAVDENMWFAVLAHQEK
jgi:ribosomal protein L11 methyltransferase